MLILNTSCKLWCHPCRIILVYGLGLWPYFFLILLIFLLQCGRWRRLAQTFFFFFFCSRERCLQLCMYFLKCIVTLLTWERSFHSRLETWIQTFEYRECSPSCQKLLTAMLLAHTTGGSYTSVFGVCWVTALLVLLSTVHFSLTCLMDCHCK